MTDDDFATEPDLADDESYRRISVKERELTRIKDRFTRFARSYASSGLEEDELLERLNEAFGELLSFLSTSEPK